jgi:uncharacterized protein YueI
MTQDLLLATRGGLGDHIISCGLVHHLTGEDFNFRNANLVCYPQWEESLRYLYEDNPRVIIHPGKQIEMLGTTHERHLHEWAEKDGLKYYSIATTNVDLRKYQEYFYKSVGHPFEIRYSKFQLPKRQLNNTEFIENHKPKNPYALIFAWDKFRNGIAKHIRLDLVDPNLEQVQFVPKKTNNIFDWLPIIYDAEEIHCIPGGPFHLIDSVLDKCRAKKFFYHDARRETCMNPNNKFNNECWEFVGYSVKHAL